MNDWMGFDPLDDERRRQEWRAMVVGACVAVALVVVIVAVLS